MSPLIHQRIPGEFPSAFNWLILIDYRTQQDHHHLLISSIRMAQITIQGIIGFCEKFLMSNSDPSLFSKVTDGHSPNLPLKH
jgi:hypothetical protein